MCCGIYIIYIYIYRIIELIPGVPNMSALRTLRIMRPLRSINGIPSMKELVEALLKSIPELANVVLFLAFIFIIFAILGVHQFNGEWYWRCRITPKPVQYEGTPEHWPIDRNITRLCGAGYSCPSNRYCGHPDQDWLDLNTENITIMKEVSYGITNYDNLGFALKSIFQVVTLEGWVDMMYAVSISTLYIYIYIQ